MIPGTDKPKCFCGIFGVFGSAESSMWTYYGLHALQHRGQEASGIVSRYVDSEQKTHLQIIKGEGLVSEVFDEFIKENNLLEGNAAIGHNRYSTTGSSNSRKNIQPFLVNYHNGSIAVAHNGNLTNESKLRNELINDGAIFQTTSDTEVILHLIARSKKEDQIDAVIDALNQIEGAFSLLLLTEDKLIAARDPFGFRPLCLGKKDGAYVVASETCALDIISATFVRDIEPGEVLIINNESVKTSHPKSIALQNTQEYKKHCIFEYIYFSRPDSFIFGHSVDKVRRRLGKLLARNHPVTDPDGDKVIVISVPDSSNTAALGYASELQKMDIPAKFELGLLRSHYIGRTFIQPGQENRDMKVKIKFNVVKGIIENKTVVVVDDSIVRGTTSKKLIALIREAKPKSIHLRISSPPITHPCYYGMDFPSKNELIAHQCGEDIDRINRYIGSDTLKYLSIENILESAREIEKENFCTACFSGVYPTTVDFNFKKDAHEI